MKSLSIVKDLVRNGITFNTIAPGEIYIEGTGSHKEQQENPLLFAKKIENSPMGRMGVPEDVSFIVRCICSPHSAFLNGACIPIDGGESRSF
jgi:3-oxoacyl-[acyl-carrier protein] reductase